MNSQRSRRKKSILRKNRLASFPGVSISAVSGIGLLLAVSLALIVLVSCDDFIYTTLMDGAQGPLADSTESSSAALAIAPSAITIAAGSSVTFTATGGPPPYTFVVVAGSGTINASTGAYTAPLAAGTETVSAMDSAGAAGEATVSVTASGTLTISPASITVAVNNSLTFIATGGVPPYTFSLTATGSGTPSVIAGTGLYTAGPSAGGDTVQVTDSDSPPSTATANATVTGIVTNIDYTISATSFPATGTSGQAIPGGSDFTIENIGAAGGSQTLAWEVYISTDAVLGSGDSMLSDGTTAALVSGGTVVIPLAGTWPASDGPYFLIAKVSAADDVTTGNNTSAGSAVTVNAPDIDYVVATVTWSTGTTAGQTVTGNFDIDNVGINDGTALVYWSVYASLDGVWDAGDALVATGNTTAMTAAEAAKTVNFSGSWPATPGNYYLVASVSAADDATVDEGATAGTQTITAPAPADVDYTIPTVTWSTGTTAGQTVTGNFDIDNVGPDDGTALVYWSVYASLNGVWDVGDALVATGNTTAMTAAEAAKNVNFSGSWPNDPADYYLVARATASDDATTAENATAAPQTVSAPDVDYTVVAVTPAGPIAVTTGAVINESFDIDNTGTYDVTQLIYWDAYVSNNTTIDVNDTLVATGNTTAMTAAEAAKTITVNTGNWPASAGGPYYLLVEIAATDDVDQSVGSNTGSSAQVTINPPDVDYTIASVTPAAPTAVTGGAVLNESFNIDNIGTDDGTQLIYWNVYVSNNTTIDVNDTLVGSGSTAAMTAAEAPKNIPVATGNWPATGGPYYLLVEITADDDTDPSIASNTDFSSAMTINPLDVDYIVSAVNDISPLTITGAAISGTFTYTNSGSDAGSDSVYWTAYRSADNSWDAGDTVLDSGAAAALPAATPSGAIGFSGTWPATAGSYYLIVTVSASDDTNGANNEGATAAATAVTVRDVDYTVSTVSYTGGGLVPAATVNGEFQFQNAGTNDGVQNVSWAAYASTDITLDPTDAYVDSGSGLAALATGATSAAIPFSGTWPLDYGNYYLLVKVSASDDVNAANDTGTTAGTQAVGIYGDVEPNGDWILLVDYQDLGATLQPGMSLRITGEFTDNADGDDIFRFDTGTATAVTFSVTWSSGGPDLSFYTMSGPSTFITGVGGTTDWLSLHWTVDAPGVMRWLDLEDTSLGPPDYPHAYTLIITAD